MKKVLITLMVALSLLFALTLVASAETVTYEGEEIELVNNLGDPSWYTGNTALAIQDKESIVILKDSEGNMKAFPSYYILKFGVDVKDGVVTQAYVLWADQNGVDYSFINDKLGTSYASGSVYYIEFPYGMTKCMSNSIFGRDNDVKPEPNFVEVVIPDSVTVMDQQAFRRMNSCKKVTLSKNLKEIPNWAFCGSTMLETVVLPEGALLETLGNSFSGCSALTTFNLSNAKNIVSIGGDAFNGTILSESIDLSNCTGLKTIGASAFKNAKITGLNLSGCTSLESIGNYAFENVSTLGFVDLSGTTSLQTIGSSAFVSNTSISYVTLKGSSCKTISSGAFNSCTSLRNITLCDSIETIGSQAFYKIGELTLASDYLPTSLKTIGSHFLSGCNIQNDVLYFPEGFTALNSEFNFNDGAKYEGTGFTLVFLGKMTAVRIDSMDANSSFRGVQIIFAQNTASEVNGKFLAGTTYNGNHAYIAKDSTGALAINKEVTTGTLTLTLRNNDPNSNGEAGTDANGNKVYSINSITPRFIFCGGNDVDLIYQVRNSISGWNYYLTTPFDYDVDAHKTANVHYDKIVVESLVNCGYDGVTTNTCVVCDRVEKATIKATGDHKYTVDNDCTTAHICTVCEKTIVEAITHVLAETIEYEGGYGAIGVHKTYCTNDGCEHNVTENVDALFTNKGYSTNTIDGVGITYTIVFNPTAIEKYEEFAKTTFEYGLIAATTNIVDDGVLFDQTGKAVDENSIVTGFRGTDYTIYNLKITSIPEEAQETGIYACAYIIDTNSAGVKTINYVGNAVATKAEAVTYQAILQKESTES